MTTEDRKVKITAEVDASQAREGFQAVKDGARDMAQSVDASGKSAGAAMRQIGEGAEDSAKAAEAAQRSILASIRRTTSELQRSVAGAGLGDGASKTDVLEAYARKRGADLDALQPKLAVLRDLESELSVATAREREFASSAAFNQKATEAARLVKAAEYVRIWETELQKAEAAERELVASRAFEQKAAEAAQLVKASSYVRMWEDELQKAEAAEKELLASRAFEQKAAEAAQLVKASAYVRMWEDELQKADAAQQKLAAETGFIDGLRRQAEAIGKSRADLLELKAAQMGVSTQAAPFIAALRQQEQSLGAAGLSAGQLNMALRSVPAQFTDIVTSISAGQSPMMVLLQQGGQLKDMFGGAGAAARAMGGYLLGLINPYTLVAAAAAAVGVAYYQGSKEADALSRAIIMTGNAAGASVGQLQDMAKAIADATKSTRGTANDAVAAAAGSGKIAAENIALVSQAAIKLNKAVGAEVAQTIDAFAELGREPVKASEKLNEKYNYLTGSIYAQIKALEDQGKTLEAGALAQKSYADAMVDRSDQVIQNLGLIETAWMGVVTAAKHGWDAILGVGRKDTLSDKLTSVREQMVNYNRLSVFGPSMEDLKQQEYSLQEQLKLTQRSAEIDAQRSQQEQARIGWLKEGERYLSKSEERERAIAKARAEGIAAGASEVEIAKRIAAIREKLADPKAPKSQSTKDLEEFERVLGRIAEKSADLDSSYFKDLNVLFKGFGDGRFGAGEAGVEKYRSAIERLIKTQKFYTDSEKLWLKQQEDGAKALAATADEGNKLQDKLDALNAEKDAYGKTESAVYRMLAARAADRAEMNAFGDANDAMIGQLKRQRDIYLELANAKTRSEQITDARKALDQLPGLEGRFDLKIDTSSLKNAFAGLGGDIGNVIDKLRTMTDVQANFGKQAELIAKAKLGTSAQYAEAVQYEIELNKKMLQASIGGYADIIGAAKGFVSERTRGYKALEAAEKAFRLVQLGLAVANATKEIGLVTGVTAAKVAGDQASTASSIASTEAELYQAWLRGEANATLAVANQAAKGDPYTAWVRMAAMAASMAALGFAVSGAGGGGVNAASAAEMQSRQGTGTVLGDASAKSQSIANALESLSDIDQLTMRYSAQMAASLRNIENSFAGLSSIVVRSYGLTTGNTTGIQTGTLSTQTMGQYLSGYGFNLVGLAEKALAQTPIIGGLISSISKAFGGVKVKLIDSGIQFDPGSISDYIAGLGMSQYGTLETTKKSWFGLSKNVSTSVVNDGLSPEITRQFSLIFGSLDTTLTTAAQALGVSTADIADKVKNFNLDLQRLSLKDMNGQQVQEALGNYFSAIFDKVSGSVLPGLEDWQKVGEGYYETLIRVATGADQARYYTEQLGITMAGLGDVASTQGDAAAELLRASITMAAGQTSISKIIAGYSGTAEEISTLYTELLGVQDVLQTVTASSAQVSGELIRAAGGLDKLKGGLDDYYKSYFSESERTAKSLADITRQFADLGMAVPETKAGLRAIVESIDVATPAGQRLAAQLLQLAGPFAEIADAADATRAAIADQAAGLQSQIDSLLGNVAAQRARELAALDPSNRALQQRIYALQDEKAATEASKAAIQAQINAMGVQFGDLAGAMKKLQPAAATLVEQWTSASDRLSALSKDLADALGQAASVSPIDALRATLGEIGNTQTALKGFADQIFGLNVEKGGQSAVDMLAAQESQLLAELATSTNPSAIAKQLADITLQRIAAQAKIWQQEQQAVYDKEYAQAKQIAQLEQDARKAQIDGLKDQISTIERMRDLSKSLMSYVTELRIGDLSALSPGDQLAQAKSSWSQLLEQSMSGNVDALSQIQQASSTYLNEAKDFFGGATNQYSGVFGSVTAAIESLGTKPVTDIGLMQAQLTTIESMSDSSVELKQAFIDTSDQQITALSRISTILSTREDGLKEQAARQEQAARDQIALLQQTVDNQAAQIRQQAAGLAALTEQLARLNGGVNTLVSQANLQMAAP